MLKTLFPIENDPIPKYSNERGYARARGIVHGTVQAAIKAGRPTPTYVDGRPKIDPERADRELALSTDLSKQGRKKTLSGVDASPFSKQNSCAAPPSGPSNDPIPDFGTFSAFVEEIAAALQGKGSIPSFAKSRAVREAYLAGLARLEYEEKTDQLVSVANVKAEAFRTGRTIRDALLNIPDRTCAQIAAICGVRETQIHKLIDDEIRRVLEGPSKTQGKLFDVTPSAASSA